MSVAYGTHCIRQNIGGRLDICGCMCMAVSTCVCVNAARHVNSTRADRGLFADNISCVACMSLGPRPGPPLHIVVGYAGMR